MKFNRIIAALLSVLMLVSAFTVVMSAEEATTTVIEYEYNTSNASPTVDYFTKTFASKEEKLETMDLRFEQPETDGFQLYVDAYSGEVAVRNKATEEVLFTNPYTVASSSATGSVPKEIMSQLAVTFIDVVKNSKQTYYSYEWAAERSQIVVRNIKNGLRVEYTIGREEARMLVPHRIEKTSFEKNLLEPMKKALEEGKISQMDYQKFEVAYTLQDPSAVSDTLKDAMYKAYPITKKMPVYVLDSSTTGVQLSKLETTIKTYAPDYSYEMLDEDHLLTEYESEDKNPPLFKMALEYTVDGQGLSVRLPANGIRFNEALYQLYSIEILPYMGAGATSNKEGNFAENNSGYTFFPDGSGTLFDFNKITDLDASTTVTGKVYGQDYAYHTISGTHQEIIRYPVFGLVETEDLTAIKTAAANKKPATEEGTEDDKTTEGGAAADAATPAPASEPAEPVYDNRGFVAIVEEGDALMELSSYHAVRTSEYNTVKMVVYPRPQDTYNVADSISVGTNDTWTVVSSRKYTGNYKVKYIMLTDTEVSKDTSAKTFYECSYVGMAKAYREYLENKGILTRLGAADVKEDIPLYIESFGALETTERFLSIPINVMTPLTTFEDVTQMYKDLEEVGVNNVNFVLTGFTKGGITDPQVPYYLKWEGAVNDEMSYEELLEDAEGRYGVYPDFDFAYVKGDKLFDGLSLKKHAVKTIDNRYSSKREYSATKHTYISYYDLALSPAYFSRFYEKLTETYNAKYGMGGVAVSTLGNTLNSDFDEDEPYNREDSKKFTVEALAHMSNSFDSVLTSGGNAYTWKYVDHITDVALDSSRYSQSAASVPFLGMVLHGYVEFAGTPLNMEGNIDYALLKAIENGASIQFILSYRNTNNLKNYEELSKYYSVRYDIWFDDVVAYYTELNAALSGVQTSLIEEHKFISGVRVPDGDELIQNAADLLAANSKLESDYLKEIDDVKTDNYRIARLELYRIVEKILSEFDSTNESSEYMKALNDFTATASDIIAIEDAIKAKEKQYDDVIAGLEGAEKESWIQKKEAELPGKVKEIIDAKIAALATENTGLESKATKLLDTYTKLCAEYGYAKNDYLKLINEDPTLDASYKAKAAAELAKIDAVIATALESEAEFIAKVENYDVKPAYDAVNAAIANHPEAGVTEAVVCNYKYEKPVYENALGTVEPFEYAELPTYDTDTNKIVYERYSDGTEFILNFNNYTVIVEMNGHSYSIDAYGYVILPKQINQ